MAVDSSKVMTLGGTAGLIARTLKVQANPSSLTPHWDGEEYDNIGDVYDLRRDGKVYSVRIPKHSHTTSTECVKEGANAGLVREPSTNTRAGRDDYKDKHPFHWEHANGAPQPDGSFKVTALEHDGMFKRDGSHGNVWVLAPTLWWAFDDTPTDVVVSISDSPQLMFDPQPGAKMPDGTVRPFMAYAAYGGGDYNGAYSSVSGVPLRNFDISQNKLVDIAASLGAGYSGKTHADDWYTKTMFLMIYAQKSSQKVFAGCTSYAYQYAPAVAETGVKRVVLTKAQAANLLVGSTMMLGNKGENASTDRNYAYNHDVFRAARITAVEPYDDSLSAVYFDVAEPFDTATDQLLSTAPWHTGACDRIQGPDGSPTSCTSGKEPFRIQGIETGYGAYEVVANVTLEAREATDGSLREDVHICHDTTKLSKGAPTADYVATGFTLPCKGSAGWAYLADIANAGGMLLGTGEAAGSSTGLGDGVYQNVADSKGYREFLGLGNLVDGAVAGLFCVDGSIGLGSASWRIASRLSGIGRSAA